MQSIDWSIPVAFVMGLAADAAGSLLFQWWRSRAPKLRVNPKNLRNICDDCTNR